MINLTSLTVKEWLVYIPIFIDFSQVDMFVSWIEKELKNKVFREVLKEIKKIKREAWISPDFTTSVSTLAGKANGFDFMVDIEFRLRTLCFNLICWKTLNRGIKIQEAFENMRKAEETFENITKQWATAPTCNILEVDPFYDAETKIESWIKDNISDFNFFPIGCDNGCTFTLSSSKLIEEDEKLPFLVTNIRDEKGILRRGIMLCIEKKNENNDSPHSYYRLRWFVFSSLIEYVLTRINKTACSIAE